MKNTINLTLSNVIKLEIFSRFMRGQESELIIPKRIKNYTLIDVLKSEWSGDKNILGIYQFKNKKYIVKFLSFSKKNLDYYKFRNEANNYLQLNKMLIGNKYIKVPKIVEFIETPEYNAIILEYIDGKRLDKYSSKKKAEIYLSIINNLYQMGNIMHKSEKNNFIKRSALDIIILYPFTLLVAFLRRKNSRKDLLKGLYIFIKNFSEFKNNPLMLAHRDAHLKNFIIKNNSKYIIDLETLGFTIPFYDIAYTLEYEFKDKIFLNSVISFIKDSNIKNLNLKYFQLIMIIVATHSLTAKDFSEIEIGKIENFLEFGVNLL